MAWRVDTAATHQDLEAFLPQPGCAVCRYVAQSEKRFFDAMIYESITDVPFRARLRASGGFCPRHFGRLLGMKEPLATAILCGDLLSQRRKLLAALRRGRPGALGAPEWARGGAAAHRRCLACEAEDEGERRACAVFAMGLDAGTLGAAWASSEGLCWPHFLLARRHARKGRATMDEVQSQRAEGMARDVQALIDSFDYRAKGGRTPEVESAWRRAVAALVGRLGV